MSNALLTHTSTILSHILILSIICYTVYAGSTLTSWNISNTTLPISIAEHACGFDPITNNIFLYFGANLDVVSPNVYSYNIQTHSISSYPSIISSIGMFYSTGYIGSPSWYFLLHDAFGQFNPASPSITYPLSWKNNSSPTATSSAGLQYACVVISLNGHDIIVTGGYDTDTISKMQIYHTITETWDIGPDMIYPRDSHGCIISNSNYLYVIGGYTMTPQQDGISNIEKIDVGNMDNLLAWSSQTGDGYLLTMKKYSMNCVLHGDNIYVIGGKEYSPNGFALTQVDIIDTKTDLVIAGPDLPIDIYSACAVVVDEMIYILGGYSDQGTPVAVNKILISNPLNGMRSATTISPTTNVPTTFSPTTSTQTSISFSPTITPTHLPTQASLEKPVIGSTEYITTNSAQGLQHNDTELETILFLIGIVLFIGIVVSILYCVYRNKSAKRNKDEAAIEKTTVSNQPLDMITVTPNGTALQLGRRIFALQLGSGELHRGSDDDDLYSDGCATSAISTPQHEITKGKHKVDTATTPESDDDMYTEVNIVTKGALETPQDKNNK